MSREKAIKVDVSGKTEDGEVYGHHVIVPETSHERLESIAQFFKDQDWPTLGHLKFGPNEKNSESDIPEEIKDIFELEKDRVNQVENAIIDEFRTVIELGYIDSDNNFQKDPTALLNEEEEK